MEGHRDHGEPIRHRDKAQDHLEGHQGRCRHPQAAQEPAPALPEGQVSDPEHHTQDQDPQDPMAEVEGHQAVLKGGDPLVEAEGHVGAGHAGVGMPDGGTHQGLGVDEKGSQEGPPTDPGPGNLRGSQAPGPERRGDGPEDGSQGQKDEGQSQVGGGNGVGEEVDDGNSSQHRLDQEEADTRQGPSKDPGESRPFLPCQIGGPQKKEDEAPGHQPVQVLPEDSPRHLRNHGPEASRPIRAGQARLGGVDHAPQVEEEEGPEDREEKGPGVLDSVHGFQYPWGGAACPPLDPFRTYGIGPGPRVT